MSPAAILQQEHSFLRPNTTKLEYWRSRIGNSTKCSILSSMVTEEGFLPGNVVSCIAAILLAFLHSPSVFAQSLIVNRTVRRLAILRLTSTNSFCKTGLQPSKLQKPTVRAGFRGSLAHVFAARRTSGRFLSSLPGYGAKKRLPSRPFALLRGLPGASPPVCPGVAASKFFTQKTEALEDCCSPIRPPQIVEKIRI